MTQPAPHDLRGRAAVITGVSRRAGIGCAIAAHLLRRGGADVYFTHHCPHDTAQPWGDDDLDAVRDHLAKQRVDDAQRLHDGPADLTAPGAPERVIEAAAQALGHVDILVCNHALSGSDGPLGELDAAQLDAHWAVNTRSSLLLAQAFARQHDGRPGGRVIFMTSGQGQGPMPGEVAYAASKAALAGVTLTLADQLADAAITVNTVNPGPVDTGWTTRDLADQLAPQLPFGRLGHPDDPARLIAWLVSDDGRWMTGQVLNTEGGFARWRARG